MNDEKPHTTRRRLVAGAVFTMLALVVSIGASIEPASAHSIAQAITYGCGTSYTLVRADPIVGSGDPVGSLILARDGSSQRYCVVTRKIASHGRNSRTDACIWRHRADTIHTCDVGSYSHFANVTAFNAQNRAIRVYGAVYTTNGVLGGERSFCHPNGASCA